MTHTASKKLSKTQKRTDQNICQALTQVCEQSLETIDGFQWLTHQANYTNFPASLLITCIFATQAQQKMAMENGSLLLLQKNIHAALFKIGVKVIAPKQQIRLDNEEACLAENQGDWKARLAKLEGRAVSKNRP